MKHLKFFESHSSLKDKFVEIAKQSIEYFSSDNELDVDVKFFDSLPFTKKEVDDKTVKERK